MQLIVSNLEALVDPTFHISQSSRAVVRAVTAILEAAQDAGEAHLFHERTELENLAEELLYMRRKLLNLPPQSSAPPPLVEDSDPF